MSDRKIMTDPAKTPGMGWERNRTIWSREQALEFYREELGVTNEELEGNVILDLGSGEGEPFGQDLKTAGINAEVISLNPDLGPDKFNEYRERLKNNPNWSKLSVSGIGQVLPFRNETFDTVLAAKSVSSYAAPFANYKSNSLDNEKAPEFWLREIIRVLKPNGIARVGAIPIINKEFYEKLIESIVKEFYEKMEQANSNDKLNLSIVFEEAPDTPGGLQNVRLLIKKSVNK